MLGDDVVKFAFLLLREEDEMKEECDSGEDFGVSVEGVFCCGITGGSLNGFC